MYYAIILSEVMAFQLLTLSCAQPGFTNEKDWLNAEDRTQALIREVTKQNPDFLLAQEKGNLGRGADSWKKNGAFVIHGDQLVEHTEAIQIFSLLKYIKYTVNDIKDSKT